MCHKVIATYQQTFQNTNHSEKAAVFKFNRIYKSKPEQYFRLKCVSLSSVAESTKYSAPDNKHCGEMFLSGLQAINKSCNFTNETEQDNRMYLGDLNGTGAPNSYFILDEIPLDNFTIYNINFQGSFTVCFHIELIEP